MGAWFEDERFWRSTYPFMFPEERFEKAAAEVDGVLELAGVAGGAVLDLCSGPGRHSVELARRGFRVTGVDRTPFLMEKAKARAAEAGVEVEWVECDMREFLRPGAFDLALSLFTSFGYFEEEEEDLRVLGNVFESLKPGGVLLVDTMGKEKLARIFRPSSADRLPDGRLMVELRRVVKDWSRCRNEWIVIDGDRIERFEFEHTIYSARELRERMEATGFEDVRIHGNLSGAPYDHEAERLTAVARRP